MTSEGIYTFFFYLLSIVAFVLAVGVVIERRLLRSAISLIGVLACGVGLSLLMGFEFVAMIQVLVFIGGIVVLLIFAIMMTSQGHMYEQRPTIGREIIGLGTAVLFFTGTTTAICLTDFDKVRANLAELRKDKVVAELEMIEEEVIDEAEEVLVGDDAPAEPDGDPSDPNNVRKLGLRLLSNKYEGFIMPFEVISLLLLAAMISGIAIARKRIHDQ